MNFHYELDKMLQTALEVNLEEVLEPSKKKSRRDSGSPGPSGGGRKKRLNREGATKFTTLKCHCGVTKKKQEDLDDHVKRRHANNHWHCVFRWFKFTLKPPYSIGHDNLQLAIWDTSF